MVGPFCPRRQLPRPLRSRPISTRTVVFSLVLGLTVAGCAGQPPTPGPFPIDGVEQLTSDYAFYQDLMWSPNGDWIAATRCPLVKFEPSCLGNEETILVSPATGELLLVDFLPLTTNYVNSYPVSWSSTGEQLLLFVRESPDENRAQLSEGTFKYIAYRPSDGGFEEIHSEIGTVFGWNDLDDSILLLRADQEGALEVGWYHYLTGEFRREFIYDDSDKLGGPHVLSPDATTLIRGNSMSPTSCIDLETYVLGRSAGFEPILTMACYPAWASSGARIAYAKKDQPRGEPNQLMIANSDGTDSRPLFGEQIVAFLASPTWSPDGSKIAFTKGWQENANGIYVAEVPTELRP